MQVKSNKLLIAALVAGLFALPVPRIAYAQTIPGGIVSPVIAPPNTVIGNIRTQAGPVEAITMAQLAAKIIGTPSSGIIPSVVVIGDSLSARQANLHEAWPDLFASTMAQQGMPVNVTNLALDGNSFYRAWQPTGYSGPAGFTFNGLTSVQYAIALKPNIVFVMLGFNDIIEGTGTGVDGRTLLQVTADAAGAFAALTAGLPSSQIVYLSELPYDTSNYAVSGGTWTPALQNQAVLPYSFCLPQTGYLSSCYCSDMLLTTISGGSVTDVHGGIPATSYSNWQVFDTANKAIAGVSSMTVNYWRIARLGAVSSIDLIHPSQIASQLIASYVVKGLRAQSWFATVFPNAITQYLAAFWNDPDSLFTYILNASGTSWVNAINGAYSVNISLGEAAILQNGILRQLHPDTWYLPYHGRFTLGPSTVSNDDEDIFFWRLDNGPPAQTVKVSVDGGAFATTNVVTSNEGNAISAALTGALALTTASHTIRYQVQTYSLVAGTFYEVYGPVTLDIAAASQVPFLRARATSNLTLGGSGAFTLLNFNTVDTDNRSGYSAGTYTCPVAGKYQVNAVMTLSGMGGSDLCLTVIYKNSSRYADGALAYNVPANGFTFGASLASHVIDCAAGDTIAIHGWNQSATAPFAIPGTANTSTMVTIEWLHN